MQGLGRWMLRAVLGFVALVLLLSLASFHPLDPTPFTQGAAVAGVQNLCGVVGATVAGVARRMNVWARSLRMATSPTLAASTR